MHASATELGALAASADGFSLHDPLRGLIRRQPFTVTPTTPVRDALEQMNALRIGSVIVVDEASRPRGILTFSDVLGRIVLAAEGDLWRPVEEVMTTRVHTLSAEASAYEAVLLMARRNIRYVCVTEADGRLLGVVSRGDLHSAQRLASEDVVNAVLSARDIASLANAAQAVRHFSHRLVGQGLGAEQAIQWISSLNELVSLQAIELVAAQHSLPEVPWCWLALGSEGRFEQTLATDQDNGLIFEAADAKEAAALRPRFLAFATAVNAALAECGFPLCRGEIMAGNPQWCLSASEWRSRFSAWITEGEPAALLKASIFFDFRALHGEARLADELRSWLTERAQGAAIFLRLMAANALQCRPPLGWFARFQLERGGEHAGTLELKMHGIRPYVDAARLFALGQGLRATNTVQRLREAGAHPSFEGEDMAAVIDGFHFIQLLRLRNQQGEQRYGSPNRLDPHRDLNHLQRRVLRHAFAQAQRLQERLQLDYRL